MVKDVLVAFAIGGGLCALAQLVLDLTRTNPAYVMVLFVSLGSVASGLGLYEKLAQLAGAGAVVPLPGFGHALTSGMLEGAAREGFLGLLKGGLEATSMGLTVAILFGYLFSILFNPKG